MADKQPEALLIRLDLLGENSVSSYGIPICAEAAAELRRLHEVNAELIEALKYMMEWQVKNVDKWHNSAYDNAAAVLDKAEEK